MNNSLQTSNGISYLARQTTDMAPITVDTTVDPLSISNLTRSDIVFVENMQVDVCHVQQVIPTETDNSERRNNNFKTNCIIWCLSKCFYIEDEWENRITNKGS